MVVAVLRSCPLFSQPLLHSQTSCCWTVPLWPPHHFQFKQSRRYNPWHPWGEMFERHFLHRGPWTLGQRSSCLEVSHNPKHTAPPLSWGRSWGGLDSLTIPVSEGDASKVPPLSLRKLRGGPVFWATLTSIISPLSGTGGAVNSQNKRSQYPSLSV